MPPGEHMKRKKREAAQAAKIREQQRVASLSPLERFQHLHNRLIGFARKSLRECIQNHGSCPPYIAGVESFLPSRLVDLKDVSKPMVVASRDITGEDRQYACLSHQWGRPDESSKKLMTTTTENIAMRFEGFLLTSLPERYQQAILLCHALDVRYIWIDSLCIIQDSPEDWRKESVLMASIYERGLFTVSSNLPGQNMPHQPPAKPSRAIKYLGVRPLSNRGGLDNSEHYTWLESMLLKGPLAQRAWCMQERYLSPVILHIFDQRYWIWECNHHIRAYNQQGRLFRSDVSDQTLPRRKNTFIPGSTPSPEAVHNLWFKMVEDYSRRQLSFISDKLPAISGMASKLQPLIKAEYLAGMWSNDIESFLWQTDNDMPRETWERVVRRPHRIYWDDPVNGPVKLKNSAAYIAPSWSWASRLTGVSWSMKPMVEESFRVFIPMATIIRHSVDTVRSDKFGHVLAGSSITLDSYLVDAPTHIKPGDLIDGLAGGDTLRTKLQLTLWYLIIGIEQRRRFGERLWRNNPYSLLGLVLTSAGTPELFHRVGVFNSPFEDYHDNGMMVDPVDVPSLIASIGERIIVEVV